MCRCAICTLSISITAHQARSGHSQRFCPNYSLKWDRAGLCDIWNGRHPPSQVAIWSLVLQPPTDGRGVLEVLEESQSAMTVQVKWVYGKLTHYNKFSNHIHKTKKTTPEMYEWSRETKLTLSESSSRRVGLGWRARWRAQYSVYNTPSQPSLTENVSITPACIIVTQSIVWSYLTATLSNTEGYMCICIHLLRWR